MKLFLKILFFIFTIITAVGEVHPSTVGIDMGGRMYDPVLGRFLSLDVALQFPENDQNYNRYSYCLNNPLRYIDPSGWLLDDYIFKNGKLVNVELNNEPIDRIINYSSSPVPTNFNALYQQMIEYQQAANFNISEKFNDGFESGTQVNAPYLSGYTLMKSPLSITDPLYYSYSGPTVMDQYHWSGPAPGTIKYSPFNVEDIIFLGGSVKAVANMVSGVAGSAAKTGIRTANSIEINGLTKHGLNRAIERGVKPDAILDAVKNPLKTGNVVTDQLGRQSQRFIGRYAEVVVNPQTKQIISVNPTSSSKAANLLKLGQ